MSMTDGHPLRDLNPRDCRFPVTAHDVTPHRFCGERAVPDALYCEHHCHVAYIGIPKKSKTGFVIYKRRKSA